MNLFGNKYIKISINKSTNEQTKIKIHCYNSSRKTGRILNSKAATCDGLRRSARVGITMDCAVQRVSLSLVPRSRPFFPARLLSASPLQKTCSLSSSKCAFNRQPWQERGAKLQDSAATACRFTSLLTYNFLSKIYLYFTFVMTRILV